MVGHYFYCIIILLIILMLSLLLLLLPFLLLLFLGIIGCDTGGRSPRSTHRQSLQSQKRLHRSGEISTSRRQSYCHRYKWQQKKLDVNPALSLSYHISLIFTFPCSLSPHTHSPGTNSKKSKSRAVPQGIVSRAANAYGVSAG